MDKKLIKVFDQEKAQELINLGYKYISETMNRQTVYSFFTSEDLIVYINKNFNKGDYFYSDKITF